MPLSQPFLESAYGVRWVKKCPIKLCEKALLGVKERETQEIVVLSCVLAHDINVGKFDFIHCVYLYLNKHIHTYIYTHIHKGYHDLMHGILHKINDIEIENVKHVSEIVDECQDEFIRMQIGENTLCVLNVNKIKQTKQELLNDNNITNDRSDNLILLQNNNQNNHIQNKQNNKNQSNHSHTIINIDENKQKQKQKQKPKNNHQTTNNEQIKPKNINHSAKKNKIQKKEQKQEGSDNNT